MSRTSSSAATSAAPLFREYRVHHVTTDGILVQLPETRGFGRLTTATLGDDLLAKRLLTSLSAREQVIAMPMRLRDAQGYRLLTVDLKEGFSAILTYPEPVRRLVQRLLRKHMLVGLGTTAAARLVRGSAKGSVLTIQPRMTAVAALEDLTKGDSSASLKSFSGAAARAQQRQKGRGDNGISSDDDECHVDRAQESGTLGVSTERNKATADGNIIEVRILNYDVNADVVNVTAKAKVVEGTPVDTAVSAAALATLHPGDIVSCTVLLSSTDDGCAVVQIPVQSVTVDPHDSSSGCVTVLGYYVYDWDGKGVPAAPVVGHTVDLVIEFCPEIAVLRDVAPFAILSNRLRQFHRLPAVRHFAETTIEASASALSAANPTSPVAARGLLGFFPWRTEYAAKARRAEESEDDEDAAEGHSGHGSAQDRQQRTRRRKLEEAIDAYERGMETAVPTSPEEFQRLLLANPNSSYVWTQYMAYHVGLQQYEAARQVAEKALSTIGVREQEELLNVWVAYLNIENLYGTEESLSAVFRRAQQRQLNQLVLFERLADIYAASRKPNQLLALCRAMTGKFRTERRTWERLGIVLVDQGKRDQLKRTLKDMGDVLKRDDATLAIVHIAIHEYKQGSPENGRALFEGLLRKVPKRSDVWSIYTDQEMGLLNRKDPTASTLQVRQIFQRTVAMNFSAKVMQQVLTRFLSFEKLHGTPADVESVKRFARTYVESKIQALTDSVPDAAAA
ncbi:rRNA biogenesis protein-like protein [Leishmania infantum JPCM5]|uniref:rRNA biogenesis protein-like protein n=1 Tax=Leishmania infantum TaxID=5671 RepID=A4HYP7_LEIIN|nr:rRNA biogenesis protein-like protein [Leishmania infantum JPCM5]CAM67435.1 rRNA biogenesis protein-like protein [Leishmania infantum JPCM5]|eukprot:XP_001465188.1 rRNA biogenesis protein-like protein [Leishmania infantum JPCM5]